VFRRGRGPLYPFTCSQSAIYSDPRASRTVSINEQTGVQLTFSSDLDRVAGGTRENLDRFVGVRGSVGARLSFDTHQHLLVHLPKRKQPVLSKSRLIIEKWER
jgi:hypothetical protein